ncbi:MAG: SRPBCC family protein [Bacteroidales bacterium]|nr:SRPBCC family protein [Bacteroidales bacterium]MCF6342384.1 SRPBCC family protein [Bacteroidales bacterium]
MKINGKPTTINTTPENVFEFLSNFNNFEQLMPAQVTNWKSDADSCTFTIQGMATIGLKYARKEAHKLIEVVPDGKSPINFNLTITMAPDEADGQKTIATVEIDAQMNPMMAMMVKKPMQNLVDVIAGNLNGIF